MPPTSIIVTIIVLAALILLIACTATYHICARHRSKTHRAQRNAEDTIRLTLSGPRSTEQVEYMKQVRERNLVIAWEEAMRFKKGRFVTYHGEGSVLGENETYIDGDDEEADLGSVSMKSGAMVLGEAPVRSQYLAPPNPPWMKRSPTLGSSVYSSDSAKSKTPTVVAEWESEHGGFSSYFGMKQPVTQERWV